MLFSNEDLALAQQAVNTLKQGEGFLSPDLANKLIAATNGNNPDKADFRNYMANYVTAYLTDEQLFKFTQSIMENDTGPGRYLLRTPNTLAKDVYPVFAKRMKYAPQNETQPAAMTILNKLVCESIGRDPTFDTKEKKENAAVEGIFFAFSQVKKTVREIDMKDLAAAQKIAVEEQKQIAEKKAEAKKHSGHLVAAIQDEQKALDTKFDNLKQPLRVLKNEQTVTSDLDFCLFWRIKDLEKEMEHYKKEVDGKTSPLKKQPAAYQAASKILEESYKLRAGPTMNDEAKKNLLSALSTATFALKSPSQAVANLLKQEAQKNTQESMLGRALSALAACLWKRPKVEGIFKHTTLAKPLEQLASAVTPKRP